MSQQDNHNGAPRLRSDPAEGHYVVTAHATNPMQPKPRAIRCNAAGVITLVDNAGVSIAYDCAKGEVLDGGFRLCTAVTGTFVAWY